MLTWTGIIGAALAALVGFRNFVVPRVGVGPLVFPLKEAMWDDKHVRVCWKELPTPHDMALVSTSVGETWEAASQLRVEWTGRCASKDPPGLVKLQPAKDQAYATGLGKELLPAGEEVRLDFGRYKGYEKYCDRDQCVKAMAAHEFGHILGFAHEELRNDAYQTQCTHEMNLHRGEPGSFHYGDYDPDSIMRYCTKNWMGGARLSQLDRDGVGYYYGYPKASLDQKLARLFGGP